METASGASHRTEQLMNHRPGWGGSTARFQRPSRGAFAHPGIPVDGATG